MQCQNSSSIISNEYFDYITDYILEDELISPNLDYCFVEINEQFRINYVNRAQLPELRVSTYYYYGIPNLYGLMQEEFDTLNLSAADIYQVQQPPLQLTGQGVLIGFIDTGERVIIMSS